MRALRFAALSLLAAILAACPKTGPSRAAAAFDATALVPANVMAVAALDVPTLLSRPGLKTDAPLVRQLTDAARAQLGVDPALLRDAVLFYAPVKNESLPRRGAAIVPASLRGAPGLGKLGASALHEGRPIFRLGETATVSFLDSATIVGDELSVRRALDRAAGKKPALAKDDALWRLVGSLGTAPFRLALRLQSVRRVLSQVEIAGLDKVTSAGLAVDVTDKELVVDLVGLTPEPEALAAALRAVVTRYESMLSRSTLLRVFAEILRTVTVKAEAGRVVVAARIPIDLVRGVLPMVLSGLGG